MEWILGILLAAMLALLCYTVFWTHAAIHKKGQPFVDSFFVALHAYLWRAPKSDDRSEDSHSGKPD